MDPVNEIQIDLVSNASLNSYPSNTLSSFTNDLHTPIKLDGEWEVALIEIFHPTTMENDHEKTVNISLIRDFGGLVKTKQFPFKYKLNEETSDIITRLNSVFESFPAAHLADPTDRIQEMPKDNKPIYRPIIIDGQLRQTRIFTGMIEKSGLLGLNRIKFLPVFDDPSFLRCLGYDQTTYGKDILKFSETIRATYERQNPTNTNLLFVYSDIVREHHVGDSMSNCLRAIPLRGGQDGMISSHTFSMPYYFPVRFGDVKNISILLTDETGTPVKFSNGRTFVTLHFRKRLYKATFN